MKEKLLPTAADSVQIAASQESTRGYPVMTNYRILFEKTGRAIYISHLDLMRTITRAFIRAGIKIKHTEGFNPHPYMTFALPLSVCVESVCELVDFILINDMPADELVSTLNEKLPKGIKMLRAYTPERKFKEIQWLRVKGVLSYDNNAPKADKLSSFFASESIIIPKKTKRGIADTDIVPCIKEVSFEDSGENVVFSAVLAAQNPALNPEHLINAIRIHLPDLAPVSTAIYRQEIYDNDMKIFR